MTDEEIIHSIRAGDAGEVEAALQAFFKQYLPRLMNTLRYKLAKIGAGSLTEDAFFEGAARLVFQLQEGLFRGTTLKELFKYFLQIAYWAGLEEYRRRQKWRIKDIQEEGLNGYRESLEMAAQQAQIEKAVQDAIGQLEGDCPRVLSLYLRNQRDKLAAIMEAFGITMDAAKGKIKRCKRKLEAYLRAHPGELDILGG